MSITVDQAASAMKALQENPTYITWCEPCGERRPRIAPANATKVSVKAAGGSATVLIEEKPQDIAHVFLARPNGQFDNLGAVAKCSTSGVRTRFTLRDAMGPPLGLPNGEYEVTLERLTVAPTKVSKAHWDALNDPPDTKMIVSVGANPPRASNVAKNTLAPTGISASGVQITTQPPNVTLSFVDADALADDAIATIPIDGRTLLSQDELGRLVLWSDSPQVSGEIVVRFNLIKAFGVSCKDKQEEARLILKSVYVTELANWGEVGSSRVDLQACKLEYSIVSPK